MKVKTAIKNVSEYMMDTETPKVIPINAAIGKTDIDLSNVMEDVAPLDTSLSNDILQK